MFLAYSRLDNTHCCTCVYDKCLLISFYVKVCRQTVHSFLHSGGLSKALLGVVPGLPHTSSYVYFRDSHVGFSSAVVCSFSPHVLAPYTCVDFAKVGVLRLSRNTVLNYKDFAETLSKLSYITRTFGSTAYTHFVFPV